MHHGQTAEINIVYYVYILQGRLQLALMEQCAAEKCRIVSTVHYKLFVFIFVFVFVFVFALR